MSPRGPEGTLGSSLGAHLLNECQDRFAKLKEEEKKVPKVNQMCRKRKKVNPNVERKEF